MTLGIIIQARLNSSRLPRKVLLPIYNQFSILDIIIMRLKKWLEKDKRWNIKIIVAYSSDEGTDIFKCVEKHDVYGYAGNNNNVLRRVVQAANYHKCTEIIRVCADNPFISIGFICQLLEHAQMVKEYNKYVDYIAHLTQGVHCMESKVGLFAEYASVTALTHILNSSASDSQKEHVTLGLYKPYNYKTKCHYIESHVPSGYKFSVDTRCDFQRIQSMLHDVGIYAHTKDILKNLGLDW